MERLNRTSAPQAKQYTEKVIQFGEGNFLRAFIEWIIWKTNQKTDFNGSVVVVQPIEKGMVGWLNEQDGLYHLNLQGLQDGQPVDSVDLIDVISRGLSPYEDFQGYLKLAEQPEMRFVISNTTEAGIAFDPSCKLDDAPASSYPGKLTQLLYHRWEYFKGDKTKGFIIFPCELIFENGKHLKECIRPSTSTCGTWARTSAPGSRRPAAYTRRSWTALSRVIRGIPPPSCASAWAMTTICWTRPRSSICG